MNTGGSAFSQTFQHITAIKLHELERQRETCIKYAEDTLTMSQALKDPVSRFDVLLKRIKRWPGTGSVLSQEHLKYDTWLQQARHDPSISSAQVLQRISNMEVELKQAITRYDYAKLFGDLLKEWLESGDSSLATMGTESTSDEPPTQAKTHRAGRLFSTLYCL
ncbi:hypothetical protein BDP27DRAFT_403018 [Rhodocollybia butyracea]|uniref:Uncharacterized protein n=1 Tax=Rhodocollybia butyracea TaxID=206335 RepID=A0A9P5P9B0_9AGAR|nr:hypothetical protein BDP27DRAFT_403018 [Rhodocollybia butyracea]